MTQPQSTTEWHTLPAEEALDQLGSSPEGLSREEAERRLAEYGPNILADEKRISPVIKFLEQFRSPLIYILLVAGAISAALRELIEAQVILAIVIFNAVIGFIQEYKAERALAALKELAAPTAKVLRDGDEEEIPSERLVPGDVIRIEAGDRIPADARLIEVARLKVEEAALTGESVPVDKYPGPVPPGTPVADRTDMIYAGTTVASGRGLAVVTATGPSTIAGQIARDVQSAPVTQTPAQRKLGHLGTILGIAGTLIAVLLMAIGYFRGLDTFTLFLTAVAVAVSFIPEGLPAVVTIVMAVGVQRMARRNAIIRKLPAVEALGSATVICTDKTGTLTKNEMTVRYCCTSEAAFNVTGEGYTPTGEFLVDGKSVDPSDYPGLRLLLTAATLCNDARLVEEEDDEWHVKGDPTEGALIVAARKAGIRRAHLEEEQPRIDEIPFDSDKKYMATLNKPRTGPAMIYVKGAPEVILAMSSHVWENGGPQPLDDERRRRIEETNRSLASQAFRVLGVGYREFQGDVGRFDRDDVEHDTIFLGLFGMIDPPRPEAAESVRKAQEAGIRIIMVTGDNPDTARAIADSLGILETGAVVTGRDVERMSDEELSEQIDRISVFARVEPQHKYRIVTALKKKGNIVAMTGDGVNDAPALKRADIGIAMGIIGTDVARESSDMILTNDNFATIVDAVEEGRTIFANLQKVVQYLLSTNTGEVLTFIVAIVAGLRLPLLPVQILWVNLITDGLPTAPLSVEPPEGQVLQQPPRDPNEPVVTRPMLWRIVMVAAIMAAGTLGVFYHHQQHADLVTARTMAFATLAMFQLFNALNARSATRSIFELGLMSNPWAMMGILAALILQIAVIQIPWLHGIFATTALSLYEWGVVTLISSTVFIAEELRKLLAPNLFGDTIASGEHHFIER